jgi:glycerophosphoryl diester phosphodiesterase
MTQAIVKGVAHRGYPVRYPENTLPGFLAAVRLGYAIVELDVQLSKDDVPVIMHDFEVDRLTEGRGKIKDLTLRELKALKVKGEGEIPTLQETLDALKGKITISIECKQAAGLYPGLEEKVIAMLEERDMIDQVYLLSFDQYSMLKARELNAKVELGFNTGSASPLLIPAMKQYNVRYMAVPIRYLSEPLVEEAQRHGVQLITWPVDTEQHMQQLLQYPSVLATTNELERFKQFYEQHEELHRLQL